MQALFLWLLSWPYIWWTPHDRLPRWIWGFEHARQKRGERGCDQCKMSERNAPLSFWNKAYVTREMSDGCITDSMTRYKPPRLCPTCMSNSRLSSEIRTTPNGQVYFVKQGSTVTSPAVGEGLRRWALGGTEHRRS